MESLFYIYHNLLSGYKEGSLTIKIPKLELFEKQSIMNILWLNSTAYCEYALKQEKYFKLMS